MTTVAAAYNLGGKLINRVRGLRRQIVRWWRRYQRVREHARHRREERSIESRVAHQVGGTEPILLGPWISEVGFEVLYWVPFLRWAMDHHGVPPTRLVAVSRGGVATWYRNLASEYVDIFDVLEPSEFASRNVERRTTAPAGGQKQLGRTELDDAIIARVKERLGVSRVRVFHPRLMYQLFRQFWFGNQTLEFLLGRVRHVPHDDIDLGDLAGRLPDDYIAVKFHAGVAIPDEPGTRLALRALVERLAERHPVVVLDPGMVADDHRDFAFDEIPGVVHLRDGVTPRNNLDVQTRAIAGARAFVGTCGGLAWLAPLLGVDTLAVYADDQLLATHLYVARHVFRRSAAAAFVPMDLRAFDRIGVPSTPANDGVSPLGEVSATVAPAHGEVS